MEGLVAPKEDGWFLSDFYLFHHLLRGLGKLFRPNIVLLDQLTYNARREPDLDDVRKNP